MSTTAPPYSPSASRATTPPSTPNPSAPAGPSGAAAFDSAARRTTSWGIDAIATLTMIGYGLVVAAGFARVFSGWAFFTPLAVITVVGFGLSFVFRRLRAPGWVAVPTQIIALVWLTLALSFRSTIRYGLPTSETWDRLTTNLALVREQFPNAVAPVDFAGGWAWLAMIGIVITVVMADAFAFRAEARGEALVPGGVLFVFIAALADDRLRVPVAVLLVFAGAMAVIALRARHDRTRRHLLGSGGTVAAAIPAAVATAAVVALAAGWLGPRLPGANADALYDTRRNDSGITNVTSPLVDIRSRLVNQSAVTVFRVKATEPSYWRTTTLPEFDGTTFRLPTRSLQHIDSTDDDDNGVAIRQEIEIVALQGVLVPAAADPVAANGSSELRLNSETNTLVSSTDLKTGNMFTVVSSRPAVTGSELNNTTSQNPPDRIFLELPDSLPDVVATRAAEVTFTAETDYEKALALQNWFRSSFDYSTEIQSGHSTNAIEAFLDRRVGYCEQFAATFAAMARTLNIPSRVAVGFTQGDLDETGYYVVRGKNAHAWPEVWFEGVGWVGFEPTPGRGAPGAEDITGVEPQQDEGPVGPIVTNPDQVLPTTTVARRPADTRAPSSNVVVDTTVPAPAPARSSGGSTGGWILLAAAIVGVLLALPWLVRRLRSSRDHHRSPAERVTLAWRNAVRATDDAGVATSPGTTVSEWADATAATYPVAAQPSKSLALVVEELSYAPAEHIDLASETNRGTTVVDECEAWSRQIADITVEDLSVKDRVVRYLTTWS